MHITTLRASAFQRACALVLLPAAIACSGDDSLSSQGGSAQAPGPSVANPNTNGSPNPGVSPGAPVNPDSSTGATPSAPISEGLGPIDLAAPATDPSSNGSDDGTGSEEADNAGSEQPPVTIPVPTGAAEACPAAESLPAMLQRFAPADEELAGDFAEYLAVELGTMTCATSGIGTRTITQTIVVPPNAVYDGNGEVLTADPVAMNCDLTEGEQAESQRPFFLLAPGASLKNVTITYPGCEGVHMMGDNVLENITWVDVGEDAASVRSYFPGGAFAILGSRADHASDKIFQFNAPGQLLIQDFVGSDMGKLVRQNGGTEFEFYVDLNNVTVTDAISAVVQSDSPLCFVRHHDLSFTFTGSGDKSDRVFRDIPVENVTEY